MQYIVLSKQETGNHGLNAGQALKAAVIKNLRGLTYKKLAFNLVGSNSFRFFLSIPPEKNKIYNEKYF